MRVRTQWLLMVALLLVIPAHAADDIQERAVPNTGVRQGLQPEGSMSATDMRLAKLQQQVELLTAQLAALQSVIKLTPGGVTLQAPTLTIVTSEALTLQSTKSVTIAAGTSLDARASMTTTIRSGSSAALEAGGSLDLKGGVVKFNGGGMPLATVGNRVQIRPGQVIGTVQGGVVVGTSVIGDIVTGSTTLLGN